MITSLLGVELGHYRRMHVTDKKWESMENLLKFVQGKSTRPLFDKILRGMRNIGWEVCE